MQCPRCARTLPDDVRFCHFCGFSLATHESGAGGTNAQAQPAGEPTTDKVGAGAQAARTRNGGSRQALPARAEADFAFQEFGGRGASLPAPPTISPPYLYQLPLSAPYVPTPPAAPARPQRRGLSTGRIVLCALLAIVLLFTGLGVALYIYGSHVLASSNAANNATKAAAMRLYQQVTSKAPTDADPLTDPSESLWSPYQRATYGCTVENDGLHVRSSDEGLLAYCLNGLGEYGDVALQIQMHILSGDAGGLTFRLNTVTQQSYFLQVGLNGVYGVFAARDPNKPVTNLARGVTQVMDPAPASVNTLTVIVKGSVFDFYINRQFVTQAQDTAFTRGYIGVLASDDTRSTEVLYTNARIWDLGKG